MARLVIAAPEDSWALKGGLAMLARAGAHARTTADADTTWRSHADELRATLDRAMSIDLHDHFRFLIGSSTSLNTEGPEGGARFPIESRLAGRLFEPIRLDINLSAGDPRPVEPLRLRNHFEFADFPDVIVPAIGAAQQLAEKVHAYTRDYATGENTRAKDLYDMLVIAAELYVPPLVELSSACRTTFALRRTPWPPSLGPPPVAWNKPWFGFVRDYDITFRTLTEAYAALTAFWAPVFSGSKSSLVWDPGSWTWIGPEVEISLAASACELR
ncbi:MAG: nucleotidyl transferase AbiEii/AbiGii toxin family protein [Mycobacteriales bacterium]